MNETLQKVLDYYQISMPKRSPYEIYNEDRGNWLKLLAYLGFKRGVEIGTERGYFASDICRLNPQLEQLYCVDVWQTYSGYRDHLNQAKLSAIHQEAVDRLRSYPVTLIEKYSMDAVKEFKDNSLDFVYIDANHTWPYVAHDLYYWYKKVKIGGIISGHDYYRTKTKNSRCHVVSVVNSFTHAYWIHPWFILGTKAMDAGIRRDRKRSWFWVKQEDIA